jgi:hypothetical protein
MKDQGGAEGEMGKGEVMQEDGVGHHEIAPTTSFGQ